MAHALAAFAAAALALAPFAAASALAQEVQPPAGLSTRGETFGISPANPYQGAGSGDTTPTFHLFGLPVRITGPVNAPYTHSETTTFAGQPMMGNDAVVARGMGGSMGDRPD